MRRSLYRFCLSAFLYWFVSTCAGALLVIPEQIIRCAAFLLPVLGLMWGPVSAAGAYVGGLLTLPELKEFLFGSSDIIELLLAFGREIWILLAGWLPCLLWNKLNFGSQRKTPSLKVHTLKKFLAVLCITFLATALFRALVAPSAELETFSTALELRRTTVITMYAFACFANDFCWAVFIDIVWFFYAVGKQYEFEYAKDNADTSPDEEDDPLTTDEHRSLTFAMRSYFLFPAAVAYLDVFHIYGMDHLAVWLRFTVECIAMADLYLVMITYMLLSYRRSIMMEIVFLVAIAVFVSTTVLGVDSSFTAIHFAKSNADDSLHAMSVICRERLDRTFFCVRQAVNGMKRQAVQAVESYDRFANDAQYRETYLADMSKRLNDIALSTDGSVAYYLRLAPEIAGSKGGFSMVREDVRWEGALPPFVKRDPIDLSLYSPFDSKNVGWYYIPLKTKSATWIEPYIDPGAKNYVISYVAPLFVEGKFIGIIGMDIDFNFIIQELRRMSIYDYGYVYVMSRNNIVLYHKDQPQGTVFQPNPEFQEIELYLTNGMWLGIAIPMIRVHNERNWIFMNTLAAIFLVAMLISIGSISFASKAIRPLAGMTDAAKRIASGDLNVTISYESGNELGLLVQSIREMAAKLEIYVYRDKLTGLRNAAAYMAKRTELEKQRLSNPEGIVFGVIIFDANFLKKVNDKYGHGAGNELIRRAGEIISNVFENSFVYRVGGDEFAAILEGKDYENREALLRLFDERTAAASFEAAGDTINISVARGLGIYKPGMDFADVTKTADDEMYKHKAAIKAKYGEDVR